MFLWLLVLWFSQLACIIAMNSSTIYVFAYSWTPGFCIGQTYPGCSSPLDYWKNNFTIHGLWPQYDTTGYPSSCTNEPFNPSIPNEVGLDTMVMRWPDVKYDVNNPNYDSFWEHEWTKHGTCSGLSQYDYFAAAIALTSVLMTPRFNKRINWHECECGFIAEINCPSRIRVIAMQSSTVGWYLYVLATNR